jgi:hypothetical protein
MCSFFGTLNVCGQSDEKSPTAKFLYKRGYVFPGNPRYSKRSIKWPDTLYYNTTYRAGVMGSPTIPFSFSKIEFTKGNYEITPTLSVGYGYTWFFGRFIFSENDIIIVNPTIFFGLFGEVGLQNNFNIGKPAGFLSGAFVGTQAFSLFAGYDFITQSTTLGLGSRIDFFTISQKSLRPLGRIRELRKRKKFAQPIIDE